jgi:hypothetical protein
MWTDYFQGLYLISLPQCAEDRLPTVTEELHKHHIYFRIVHPQTGLTAEHSIWNTYDEIISNALDKGKKRILVFEDDVQFLVPPSAPMTNAINSLKTLDWDLFYFGPNTHQNFTHLAAPHLLQVQNAFGLHATAFSYTGMKKVLQLAHTHEAIDAAIADQIQPDGECFCTYPLLATQRSGYSYVQKKVMDQSYIQQRFDKHVKPLEHLFKPHNQTF